VKIIIADAPWRIRDNPPWRERLDSSCGCNDDERVSRRAAALKAAVVMLASDLPASMGTPWCLIFDIQVVIHPQRRVPDSW